MSLVVAIPMLGGCTGDVATYSGGTAPTLPGAAVGIGYIAGRVVDEAGSPLGGVTVRPDFGTNVFTDADGRFDVAQDSKAGRDLPVTMQLEGREILRAVLVARASPPPPVTLRMLPVVVLALDTPATVTLFDDSSRCGVARVICRSAQVEAARGKRTIVEIRGPSTARLTAEYLGWPYELNRLSQQLDLPDGGPFQILADTPQPIVLHATLAGSSKP